MNDVDRDLMKLDKLSDNHMLRFFYGQAFDPQKALIRIKEGEQWMLDNNMWEIKPE
jgi:hypothetical protein